MKTADFDYHLPPELIAQHPAQRRDESRMLVLDRAADLLEHRSFRDFPAQLHPGDVLVLNDTKVIPARLLGHRSTGARVEIFLLHPESGDRWRCLVQPGRKVRPGDTVQFGNILTAYIVERHDDGSRSVAFEYEGDFEEVLMAVGQVPLPPYIKRQEESPEDQERYQTVYAAHPGAVAAPTAGLHFTPEVLKEIEDRGVRIARITLHVGIGTFKPVTADIVEEHRMETERYDISEEAAKIVNSARPDGRIVAVGTTCVRTLESAWCDNDGLIPGRGRTNIFITPGHHFRAVDALLTNFHLPRSTLIMLVSALAGRERTLATYTEAVKEKYRFYSYGDCMFIA